jgi:hypothetical protein
MPQSKISLQVINDFGGGIHYYVKTPVTAVGCGNVKKAKARPLKIEIPLS